MMARRASKRRWNFCRTSRWDSRPWPRSSQSVRPCEESVSKTLTANERSRLTMAAVSLVLVAALSSWMSSSTSVRRVLVS